MHSNSALLMSLLRLAKPGLASTLTMPQLFLLLFLVALYSTCELAKLKMLILNRWRRRMASTSLIWIFGSRLILSKKKQSSATLWVRDTCLIAGLLPLMIILITASLSSKCRASHQIKKTSRSTKRNQHHSIQDCCAWLELRFGFGCACLMWCYATSFLVLDSLVFCDWCGEE